MAEPLPTRSPTSPSTRLDVLLFTDIVGSTDLKTKLGTATYTRLLARHNEIFESGIRQVPTAQIIKHTGDGYFAAFTTASDAVRFALVFQSRMWLEPWEQSSLKTRVGIHVGEVALLNMAGHQDVVGLSADLAARIMSLAQGGQILLTSQAFNDARQFVSHAPDSFKDSPPLRWLAHGPYLFKGADEPLDVFEVGIENFFPLTRPPDSEKAKRVVPHDQEPTLGWRPAVGLDIPSRPNWVLERKIGDGGFGEVWLGIHEKLRERRVFKFCFDADRLRSFKRELTLFRLLREALGDRKDIARLYEVKLDEPPFFLESEYTEGGNLLEWSERKGGIDKLSLAERLDLIARVADAVAAAHSIAILHKDIKPSNILIHENPDGSIQPRLSDFGIGILADRSHLRAHSITETGFTRITENDSSRTGTRMYAPPESLSNRPFTVQGDVYALGMLLYQIVVADFARPLGPGWERDIADPILREDIAAAVDRDVARRIPTAVAVAERIRSLESRRRERIAADRAAEMQALRLRRRRIVATGLSGFLFLCLIVGIGGTKYLRDLKIEKTKTETALILVQQRAGEAKQRMIFAMAQQFGNQDPLMAVLLLRELPEHALAIPLNLVHEAMPHNPVPTTELRDHQGIVGPANWSPDGRRILITSEDGAVHIWNVDGTGERFVLNVPGEFVLSAAWSPDGKHILTGWRDSAVRIWNADGSGEPLVLRGHQRPVTSAVWSPDGKRIVTTSGDKTARIWNADGSAMPKVLSGHDAIIVNATWSPDGHCIATWSNGPEEYANTVRIWNADGDGEPVVLRGPSRTDSFMGGMRLKQTVAWSPDSRRIACVAWDETIRIWNVDGSGEPLLLKGHERVVNTVAWSPDGKRILSSSADTTARIWNVDGAYAPIVLRGHQGIVAAAIWSPDGKWILTNSGDNTARIWNADTSKDSLIVSDESLILNGHRDAVLFAAWSPDGRRIVTTSSDNTARIWDMWASGEPRILRDSEKKILDVAWSPDGNRVVTASGDGRARIWTTEGPAIPIILPDIGVIKARWSPNGNRIITSLANGTSRLWNADGTVLSIALQGNFAAWSPDGKHIVTIVDGKGGKARVYSADGVQDPIVLRGHEDAAVAEWSPDGKHIATVAKDNINLNLQSLRIGSALNTDEPIVIKSDQILEIPMQSAPRVQGNLRRWATISWSPDSSRLVMGSINGSDVAARVFDASGTGPPLILMGHQAWVTDVSWGPDGKRIVTASRDGTVRVWNIGTPSPPIVLSGHKGSVESAAWSPNGSRIATASSDQTARVWNIDAPDEPIILKGHWFFVTQAVWSPDGRRIVTASEDHTARIWIVDWPEIRRKFWECTNVVLSPEERQQYLGETPEEAAINAKLGPRAGFRKMTSTKTAKSP